MAVTSGCGSFMLTLAKDLLVEWTGPAPICAVGSLLDHLVTCSSVVQCSFYWVALILFLGIRQKRSPMAEAWSALIYNVTYRFVGLRSKEINDVAQERLHFFGHNELQASGATILLYADSMPYFSQPNVEPFVRQLGCYANGHDIRLKLDGRGPRVRHTKVDWLDVSIVQEFFISAREQDAATSSALSELYWALRGGQLERLGELHRFERALAINYAHPLNFDRIWAIEEHMAELEHGKLLIYYDADVTVRPDNWHLNLAQLILEQRTGYRDGPAHIFLADSWTGMECVNSGFVAFRNTEVARLFLELWKQKLYWASGWDQAALGETVLEILGAEAWKLSGGERGYDHRCLSNMFPMADGTYAYQRFCDCYQSVLDDLVGPYRQRKSRVVAFVDPERVEVNFVPNNLFWDHHFTLGRMHLHPASQPTLHPMVVHWAGLVPQRLELLKDYFKSNFNASIHGCPRALSPTAPRGPGSVSRHLRCCLKLQQYSDKSGWPWNLPNDGWVEWVHFWGCNDWPAVTMPECDRLLGTKIVFTGLPS